jgi:hypothetical protein
VRRSTRGRLGGWLCLGLAGLAACAETTGSGRAPAAGPRQAADDGDLWNLVPGAAEAVADVDLQALRASPWSHSLMTGDFGGEREARRRLFGYDVFTEADRLLAVGMEAGGTSRSLTIARGSFDAGKIGAAFTVAAPGATATRWRDSPLWEVSGRAVALVTPRTLAQGDPETVRAAVDAAWGVVADARAGELGELRRQLGAEPSRGAVVIAVSVTEGMRQRAAGFVDVPPELRRLAARLDLGDDLTVNGVAMFDGPRSATAAATMWADAARQAARQPIVRLLGLGPIVDGLSFRAQGPQVAAVLTIPASKRDLIAEKLIAILQALAAGRGSTP